MFYNVSLSVHGNSLQLLSTHCTTHRRLAGNWCSSLGYWWRQWLRGCCPWCSQRRQHSCWQRCCPWCSLPADEDSARGAADKVGIPADEEDSTHVAADTPECQTDAQLDGQTSYWGISVLCIAVCNNNLEDNQWHQKEPKTRSWTTEVNINDKLRKVLQSSECIHGIHQYVIHSTLVLINSGTLHGRNDKKLKF